ncbi:MAG: arginase, partial [Ferruginibacter sp.]
MEDLKDFLQPVSLSMLNDDQGYTDGQLGKHVLLYDEEMPDVSNADLVILGIKENRGAGNTVSDENTADIIRKHLYQLHFWHTEVTIADIGNVEKGNTINDSYAAIKTMIIELLLKEKTVILLGGSH